MSRVKAFVLSASPIIVVAALFALEIYLFRDRDPIDSVDDRKATIKMAVDLSSGLVSLFISISTATIGAVAYYLRTRLDSFEILPLRSLVHLVLCIVASVLSIYFGHLELVTMRNQLAFDAYDATTWVMQWTERFQFGFLMASLGWFGLLVVEREANRRVTPQKGG